MGLMLLPLLELPLPRLLLLLLTGEMLKEPEWPLRD
jgi:hypothetical protein